MQKQLQQANVQGAQQAQKQNKSFLPTLFGGQDQTDPEPAPKKQESQTYTPTAQKAQPSQAQLQNIATQQAAAQANQQQQAAQQRQQAVQDLEQGMRTQAQALMSSWTGKSGSPAQQYIERTDAPKSGDKKEKPEASEQSGDAKKEEASQSTQSSKSSDQETIKAGKIMFAVLNTAVNSDEPGPILATIVGGKYKGAKLLGKIQKPQTITGVKPSALTLTFNLMNVP